MTENQRLYLFQMCALLHIRRKQPDMFKRDVLEPLVVKEQIINSATEAASMLLRIDDVIAAGKSKMPPGPPGGGGGMGSMGGGYGGGMDME